MKALTFCVVVSAATLACATAGKMNQVSVGMTRDEVVTEMGEPSSTSASTEVEYLKYLLYDTDAAAQRSDPTTYYVKMVDGLVESFGRLGDFDSTKDPTLKLETREAITLEDVPVPADKARLAEELRSLKELLDDGIITQAEFDTEKAELLARY